MAPNSSICDDDSIFIVKPVLTTSDSHSKVTNSELSPPKAAKRKGSYNNVGPSRKRVHTEQIRSTRKQDSKNKTKSAAKKFSLKRVTSKAYQAQHLRDWQELLKEAELEFREVDPDRRVYCPPTPPRIFLEAPKREYPGPGRLRHKRFIEYFLEETTENFGESELESDPLNKQQNVVEWICEL